jgi:hypothetical protein
VCVCEEEEEEEEEEGVSCLFRLKRGMLNRFNNKNNKQQEQENDLQSPSLACGTKTKKSELHVK